MRTAGGYVADVATVLEDCGHYPGYCKGYLAGIAHFVTYMPETEGRLCIPPDVTFAELEEAALPYLRSPNVEADEPATPRIVAAFFQRFPCRRTSARRP